MLYIVAIFIPPLAVLLAGRFFTAIFLFLIWIFLLLFVFIIPGHIITTVLAWIIVANTVGERRHRESMSRR